MKIQPRILNKTKLKIDFHVKLITVVRMGCVTCIPIERLKICTHKKSIWLFFSSGDLKRNFIQALATARNSQNK